MHKKLACIKCIGNDFIIKSIGIINLIKLDVCINMKLYESPKSCNLVRQNTNQIILFLWYHEFMTNYN